LNANLEIKNSAFSSCDNFLSSFRSTCNWEHDDERNLGKKDDENSCAAVGNFLLNSPQSFAMLMISGRELNCCEQLLCVL
jgi:hypothetical protein